jgi:AbrB family looped-hinge helix DNA binding protein
MTDAATLSSKNQVSIPKAVRDHLHWLPGQKLAFFPKGNGVLMIPIPNRDALAGIARGASVDNYRDRSDRY